MYQVCAPNIHERDRSRAFSCKYSKYIWFYSALLAHRARTSSLKIVDSASRYFPSLTHRCSDLYGTQLVCGLWQGATLAPQWQDPRKRLVNVECSTTDSSMPAAVVTGAGAALAGAGWCHSISVFALTPTLAGTDAPCCWPAHQGCAVAQRGRCQADSSDVNESVPV